MHCEICGSENINNYFKKGGFQYQRCSKCGLIRLYPQPDDKQLDAIYNNKYYAHWGGEESVFSQMKKKTFRKLLNTANLKEGKGLKLLDIGAATGLFMECAAEKGYDVFGIEAAKDGARLTEQKFGKDKIYNAYFDETFSLQTEGIPQQFKGPFDIIVMSDLFEHLRKPSEALGAVKEILNSKGRLVIALPDTSSLSRILMRRHWPHFIPEHLFSFSKSNIKMLLEKNGFKTVKIISETKYLTIKYAKCWFMERTSFLDKILSKLLSLSPKFTENAAIPVKIGQIAVVAEKIN